MFDIASEKKHISRRQNLVCKLTDKVSCRGKTNISPEKKLIFYKT